MCRKVYSTLRHLYHCIRLDVQLSAHTHLSIVLIIQFIIGFTVTGVDFNVCNTLPDRRRASFASSVSVSITRCLVAVAVIEVLMNAAGAGMDGRSVSLADCVYYVQLSLASRYY